MSPSAPGLVAVLARRELLARLRDRTFLVSTVVLLVLVAASVTVPLLLSRGSTVTIGVVGARAAEVASAARALSAGASPDRSALTVRELPDAAGAERLVREGGIDAALVPDDRDPARLALVGHREVPAEVSALVARALVERARAAPAVRLLEPPSADTDLALGGSMAFSMLFLLASFLFGMSIAQSAVEEKQSRIVEILVAAVPVRVLLAGKVLGNTALALGQIVLFVAVGLAGASLAGQSEIVRLLLGGSGWFLLFFVLGFAMLACLWAAAGALAGRQEDLQATTAPLQLLLFVPFVAGIYVATPGAQLTAMSYVPFTAPIAMPRRLLLHDAAGWEAILSAVGLLVTAMALVALATRIYERSLLAPGGRIGWAAGLRGRRAQMESAVRGV